jgi:tRNA (guanine37-N1)-methyltransferase
LSGVPGTTSPKRVRASVSADRSKPSSRGVSRAIVRQQPLTEMLSPGATSSKPGCGRSIASKAPSPARATLTTDAQASTSPVNTAGKLAGRRGKRSVLRIRWLLAAGEQSAVGSAGGSRDEAGYPRTPERPSSRRRAPPSLTVPQRVSTLPCLFDEEGLVPLFLILTLFPEAVEPYLSASILGLARQRGLVDIRTVDFRDFTRDRHRTVDDRPFGGGPGMVLQAEPIAEAIEWAEERHGRFRRLVMCPSGRALRQELCEELAREERVLLIAARYEGFDERLREEFELEPISLGDFVLSGGELPALAIVEAAVRLIPGVLGAEESAGADSFSGGERRLDWPHYTRPRVWRGRPVPEVLLSGDHAAIARWRREAAEARTRERRPDLIDPHPTHPGGANGAART